MKIGKEDLLRINKGFGGNLRSGSSIDYAFYMLGNKKLGFYKKLAYFWRAILVDHPFSDGNKRTAAFLAYALASENKKRVIDRELLMEHIVSIAKHNETNIRNIEYRLKNIII
ncbi:MAG: Fic family protein [Candidatus Pacearchaeota archaeon]